MVSFLIIPAAGEVGLIEVDLIGLGMGTTALGVGAGAADLPGLTELVSSPAWLEAGFDFTSVVSFSAAVCAGFLGVLTGGEVGAIEVDLAGLGVESMYAGGS